MTWIAPNNVNLSTITGMNNGVGLNPFPTFDWNVMNWDSPPEDPLIVPFFNTANKFVGTFFSMFVVLGLWYTNTYNTGYLPLNTPRIFDHFGKLYNVSKVIDSRGLFAPEKYEAYSQVNLSAGYVTAYLFFFAVYTSAITYVFLYHRQDIAIGFRNLFNSFRKNRNSEYEFTDIHNRLMTSYSEGE
jgi:hypothetical protein